MYGLTLSLNANAPSLSGDSSSSMLVRTQPWGATVPAPALAAAPAPAAPRALAQRARRKIAQDQTLGAPVAAVTPLRREIWFQEVSEVPVRAASLCLSLHCLNSQYGLEP